MGMSFIFKCKSCDHIVKSSGEPDYGFFAVVKPFLCHSCNDVFDIQVGEAGQVTPEDKLNAKQKEKYYICPKCKGKRITEWSPNNRECPKCEGRMLKKEMLYLWD